MMENVGSLFSLSPGEDSAKTLPIGDSANKGDFEAFFKNFTSSLQKEENNSQKTEITKEAEVKPEEILALPCYLPFINETEPGLSGGEIAGELAFAALFSEEDIPDDNLIPRSNLISEMENILNVRSEELDNAANALKTSGFQNTEAKETTETIPETISGAIARVTAEKQKEKAEKDYEKNLIEKRLKESENTEKVSETEIISGALSEELSLNSLTDLSLLTQDTDFGENADSSSGMTKLAALMHEFIEGIKPEDNKAKTENKTLFDKMAAEKLNKTEDAIVSEKISEPEKLNQKEQPAKTAENFSDLLKSEDKKLQGITIKESVRQEAEEKISLLSKYDNRESAEEQNNNNILFNRADKNNESLFKIGGENKDNLFNIAMKEVAENNLSEDKQVHNSQRPYNLEDIKETARLAKTIAQASAKGESRLTVTLTPENLGRLEIRLVENGGKISAKFFTDNETSHKMMISHGEAIKQQLSEKGITIDNIEFAFRDPSEKGTEREYRRTGKEGGSRRNFKNNKENSDNGTDIALTKQTGIYA